jgi:hypothetical protein
LKIIITTHFNKGNTEVGIRGRMSFITTTTFLRLGILLIEISLSQELNGFEPQQGRREARLETEANIDLQVAHRVVKNLDDVPYRAAIQTCLELDWFPEDQRVLLRDLTMRKDIYDHVIALLKQEQRYSS